MKKQASIVTLSMSLCLLLAASSSAGMGTCSSRFGPSNLWESTNVFPYSASELKPNDKESAYPSVAAAAVFPPDSKPFGKTFAEWSAEWWQLMFSIPVSVNPLFDTNGSRVVAGQRGPVWLLAGSWLPNPGPVKRTCTIPEGKALFFPVVNTVWFDSPGVCGETNHYTIKQLRKMVAGYIDKATNLSVTLDGISIPVAKKNRIKSGVFEVSFPEKNVYDSGCSATGGFPAGTWYPSVDDGYYLMLEPLSVGDHTLRIRSEIPGVGSLDVTYKITVTPVSGR